MGYGQSSMSSLGAHEQPSVYPVTSVGPGFQQVLSKGEIGERKDKGREGRFFFYQVRLGDD